MVGYQHENSFFMIHFSEFCLHLWCSLNYFECLALNGSLFIATEKWGQSPVLTQRMTALFFCKRCFDLHKYMYTPMKLKV